MNDDAFGELFAVIVAILVVLMVNDCMNSPVSSWGCNAPPVDVREEPFQYGR